MSVNWLPLAIGILASAFGYLVGYLFSRRIAASRVREATKLSTSMLEDARKTAGNLKKESDLEARNKFLQMKVQFEEESKDRKESLKSLETQLSEKESNLERKLNFLTRKDATLVEKNQALETKENRLDERLVESNRLIAEQNVRLERIAGMRKEEAKRVLLKNLEDEARLEAAKRAREIRETAERAVSRIDEFDPFTVSTPVTAEVRFKNYRPSQVLALLPMFDRPDAHSVRFTSPDMLEVSRVFHFITQYGTVIDP